MITYIHIQDFQSIEDVGFDCGPITVITGESDTGKSSIVRAIYSLAFNSYPKGHVRAGAKASTIVINVDDLSVQATKGEGVNLYRLFDGEEVIKWERVGTEVPDAVTETLGLRKLELDDGSSFTPNIQRQFDPPFLLTDSPSKVAKVLGALTNISILYGAVKVANTWERRSNGRIEAQHEVAARAIEQITPLAQRVELDKVELDLLMVSVRKAQVLAANREVLEQAMVRMMAAQEQYQLAQGVLAMMDASLPDLSRADELVPRLQGLTALATTIEAADKDLLKAKVVFAELTQVGERRNMTLRKWLADHDVCPLCGRDGWQDDAGRHDEH